MSSEAPVRRLEDWQQLISEHKQGGLAVKAFCQKHGVSEALFYSWRKRLVAEDQPSRFALVATNGVRQAHQPYRRYSWCWRAASVLRFRRASVEPVSKGTISLPRLPGSIL